MKLLSVWAVACLALQATAAAIQHKLPGFTLIEHPDPEKRALTQDIVRYSEAQWSLGSLIADNCRLHGMSTLFLSEGRGL